MFDLRRLDNENNEAAEQGSLPKKRTLGTPRSTIEAPRGWGVGRGCPFPTGGIVWGCAPSPEKFFDFGS